MRTILNAALSRTFRPEERSSSTAATLPSGRTVTLRADGNVHAVELDRSSGLKVLDAAAFKIVRMATPFAPFPPNIRRDTDLLVITRTWFFGRGDKLWTE